MQQQASAHMYLSVRVLMVLVVAGVVILLDEAKIFLPLPLQDTLPSLCVSWEVTLPGGDACVVKKLQYILFRKAPQDVLKNPELHEFVGRV